MIDIGQALTAPRSQQIFLGDDMDLALIDYGGAGEVPVLLLHGVTGHAGMWAEFAPYLTPGRRTIAIDLPGHGDSARYQDSDYSTEKYMEEVKRVIEWLGTPVDIVGLSWGGLIGVHLSALNPQLVRKLVIVDAAMGFEQSPDAVPPRPKQFDSIGAAAAWESEANVGISEELARLFARQGCLPIGDGQWQRKHDPVFFSRWAFREDSRWDEFSGLEHDVLLVRGGNSRVMPAAAAERMRELRPQTDFRQIEDAGHLVPLDSPSELGTIVAEFLGQDSRVEL